MIHSKKIKQTLSFASVLACGLVFVSCLDLLQQSNEDGETVFQDLYEPNNTAQEATEIVIGENVEGSIQVKGDEDYYTFVVPDSLQKVGYVVGTLSPFPGKPYLYFYNEQKQLYGSAYNYNTTEGADLSGWITVIPGKRYYTRVKDYSSQAKSDRPYTLNVKYFPIEDPYEPDNKIEEATVAQLDSVYQAYLFKGTSDDGDGLKDYFKYTLPVDGDIEVSLTSFPTTLSPQFWVLGSGGESISRFNYRNTNGADLIKTIEGVKAGIVYIYVGTRFPSEATVTGKGNQVPDHLKNMYALKVSMK